MTTIDKAQPEKIALFFGRWESPGHYLYSSNGRVIWDPKRDIPGFPWSNSLLDGGLLKNGNHKDAPTGDVFWTVGGTPLWYAFFWWDRSGDRRGASCSGFYVSGFPWPAAEAAFLHACSVFPKITNRQHHVLVLQDPK